MHGVAKVFRILETVVAHQERGLAYSEVVAKTLLPKATVHRVLKSLVQLGYLRFSAEAGRYYGDLRLSTLGSAVTSHFDLKEYVRPHLLELRTETGHTCNLGILSGDAGVYLDKLESLQDFGIKLYSAIGKRFPLHCTGMGKVLLADMPPADRRKILARRLAAFTRRTITDSAALERELGKVRRSGYALDQEEITRGIVCVAAPLRDGQGATVAAISAAFPAYIAEERGMDQEIRAVTACAAEVSRLLAGSHAGDGAASQRNGRSAPAAMTRG